MNVYKYKEETQMGFIPWIVVGLIAGWLPGQVMKGGGYGVLVDIIPLFSASSGVFWAAGSSGFWASGRATAFSEPSLCHLLAQ
jgi:uncharacterized membrane protein YeaQ/YmgE (transglycosylase-associated protein family)